MQTETQPFVSGHVRVSIRSRLLLITASLILVSLGVMILTASFFFQEHSETMIQESNLGRSRLLALRMQTEIGDLIFAARTLMQLSPDAEGQNYRQRFFEHHKRVAMALKLNASDGPGPVQSMSNVAFMQRNELHPAALESSLQALLQRETVNIQGQTLLMRFKYSDQITLLCLLFPVNPDQPVAGSVVLLIEMDSFIKDFQDAGQIDVFDLLLVDRRGRLIATSDPENFQGDMSAQLPIVRSMLESGSPNGSKRYTFKDIEYLGAYQMLEPGQVGIISSVPADKAFAAVALIQRQNIRILVIVLAIAFVCIYFFSRTLTAPIGRLMQALRKVEAGNYDLEIVPTHRDEVGALTLAFNHMAQGLAEREKIRETFGKFVNPAIVNHALRNPEGMGGERRNCVVMFSDLRDFTNMSENMEPEEVVQILSDYFTGMVDCIHAQNGLVDKFIGDAVMAHWGAIVKDEHDCQKSVEAALAMRRALIALNQTRFQHLKKPLRFGVGINYGAVLAGQIGSHRRMEYTVIGDVVNLASRIEYLNKHFGTDILLSSYVREKLPDIYRLVELPATRIKGKAEAEVIYAVIGRLDRVDDPCSLQELRQLLGIEISPEVSRRYRDESSDIILAEQQSRLLDDAPSVPVAQREKARGHR